MQACLKADIQLLLSLYATYFIARRTRKASKKSFSTIVHKIGVISIALGLAIPLLALLVIKGFQENIEQKLTNFRGQLQITRYSLSRSGEEVPISVAKIQGIQQAFPAYVREIQIFTHKTILLKTGEAIEGVLCKGLDAQVTHERLHNYLLTGRLIEFPTRGYSHEIVLSNKTATRLNVQIGDTVTACMIQQQPRYRKLRVVGIYTTYLEELDEKLAFCDLRLIQRLNNWPDTLVGGCEVFLRHAQQAQALTDQLLDWLDYDLTVDNTAEAYAPLFDWLAVMRKDVLVFLTLILLVASSNIVSIVLIQMMERTAMIGLLQALGATYRQIQRIMLWGNLYLALQGMLWGNLVGLGLGALQAYFKFIRLDPMYYYIDYVPIVWSGWGITLINMLIFLIITLVLMISISIITKIKLTKAIHFQ